MSGGNNYDRSDFGVASKYYFNWMPSSSIISMQPEGSTSSCPSCISSGSFTLNAFDDWSKEPANSNDFRGIHIPVFSQYDEEWDTDIVSRDICMRWNVINLN